MNTLTSQEINTMPVTNEEEEAMQRLLNTHVQEVCTTTTQPEVNIEGIINTICSQLQLLTSVISQSRGNSLAEQQSLQDCVTTVLQQGNWFTEKVNEAVEDVDFEDAIKDAVSDEVGSIVENYFSYEFQLSDHVDINDMVREQVEEKFENIKISFD